jgi:predicted NUDIX family phosphoesterase
MPISLTGNVPRACPRPCGECCRSLWQTVPQLEQLPPQKDGSCPFLGLLGCRLQKPPLPCRIYLCDLAEARVKNRITQAQFERLQKLRARKNAMIKDTQEKVLCIPNKEVSSILPKDIELCLDQKANSVLLSFILEHHSFLDRDVVEYDPAWRQVIPYQVAQNYNAHPAQYLLMTRTKKQTEERLHEKLSLGIGGHMNPIESSALSVLTANMRREQQEEIQLDLYTESFVGVIRCDTTEVDKVHLGLVYLLGVHKEFEVREKENMKARWAYLSEILEAYPKLERWSQLVATFLKERSR